MFTLHKGDCEHCGRTFHYTLLHAGFGDYSYAYCDTCGALGTFNYANRMITSMPPISVPHQVIDAEWEPFIRPCECGGHFRHNAQPRCVHCNEPLSPELATTHIERNSVGAPRGWTWQKNWHDIYCIDIENPRSPGILRQVSDPFINPYEKSEKTLKGHWFQKLSIGR